MRRSTVILWACLALACASQSTHGAAAASVKTVAVVPVETYGNHLFVKVRVNGSEPLDFVLDTGASDYGLNRRRADALGIPLKPLDEQGDVGTGEGSTSIAVANDVSFGLGGVELAHKVAYAVPFGDLEELVGRPIDGVIGADLFDSYVVEIAYSAKKIVLFDRASYRYSGSGVVVPLTFSDGRPFARAAIELAGRSSLAGSFIVDTGDSSALGLHTPFVQQHKLPPPGQPVLADVTYGIAGQAKELLGRVQSLRLGRFVLKRPVVSFAQAAQGSTADPSYDGAIGGEVLRRFTVIFDYSRKRMILERGTDFDAPFEVNMSGLTLVARGPDFSSVEVSRMSEHSPASESGLRAGDRIVTLDGRPAADHTLAVLDAMFRTEGREYRLTVKRGDQVFEATLKTRRRI